MKTKDKMDIQDWYQAWKDSPSDQRRWDRYPPVEGTHALLEGRFYWIMDISGGGLAIYNYGEEAIPEETVVSIHSTKEGYFLDNIRCRKISDSRVVLYSTYSSEVIRRIGLQIVDAGPEMGAKLEPFMNRS